ncbi:MAG: class I SAM-dependent methyltransferase [Halolamina sp.]
MTDGGADPHAVTQSFYTRYADLYDLLSTRGPLVGGLRRRAAAALAPATGDTVVEFGCGTGANFPYLREAVGPQGRVVGVDFAPGMVARADRRGEDDAHTHVVRGDATSPAVGTEAVDAVVATFVSGMLGDPAATVDAWADLVGSGGRLCLLDLARSTGAGRPLNPLFRRFVAAGSPPGTAERHGDPVGALDERVADAHRRLFGRCVDPSHETALLGFGRLSAGTVE